MLGLETMGAPKQKWTKEEEAALRAGIEKYGPGKWSAILKDPALSCYLASRSNVDLKDKWRNINVTAHGWGSREKARLAFKKSSQLAKQTSKHLALSTITNCRSNIALDARPLATINASLPSPDTPRSFPRFDNLVLDAISCLKEPKGSNKSTIAMYIEENHLAPPHFKKLLSPSLKCLTERGKLVKMGQNYMVGGSWQTDGLPKSAHSRQEETEGKRFPNLMKDTSKKLREEIRLMTKSEIDAELSKMTLMNAEEAAATAAKAVAEAELAIAQAEEAAKDAEAAEADAEAAQAFAEAAMLALRNSRNC